MEDLFVKMYKNEEDYNDIKTWAMKNGMILPPEEALPGVGVIVIDKNGKKYGCGFLYLDNETIVSVIEWVYVEPDLNAKEKIAALKVVLNVLESCAIEEEHPMMFSGSSSDGLTRLYEKCGWSPTVRNMTHLIKIAKTED